MTKLEDRDSNGWTAQERLDYIYEAIDWVDYHFEQLRDAASLGQEAAAFNNLSNSMSDLRTWHPKYDEDKGTIEREEE